MMDQTPRPFRPGHFLRYHSLSLVTLAILTLWIVLYSLSDPGKHLGAFYGNAIADWSGSLVFIIGSKFFLERGSEESRPVKGNLRNPMLDFLRSHSLSLFLIVTGLIWVWLYVKMDAGAKWGQVVGNIVSEWLQTLGLVLMTKRLIERGSKESHKG
jgi:hypothetical protein